MIGCLHAQEDIEDMHNIYQKFKIFHFQDTRYRQVQIPASAQYFRKCTINIVSVPVTSIHDFFSNLRLAVGAIFLKHNNLFDTEIYLKNIKSSPSPLFHLRYGIIMYPSYSIGDLPHFNRDTPYSIGDPPSSIGKPSSLFRRPFSFYQKLSLFIGDSPYYIGNPYVLIVSETIFILSETVPLF